jgi:hypothetical protein
VCDSGIPGDAPSRRAAANRVSILTSATSSTEDAFSAYRCEIICTVGYSVVDG